MNYSVVYCMSCRKRAVIVAASSAGGLLLIVTIAIVTICLCKQKHRAEKAKQKLSAKMKGCEETVVKLPYLNSTRLALIVL